MKRALAHNTAATMRDSISLNIDNSRSTMNELRKSYLSVALVEGNQMTHSRRGTRVQALQGVGVPATNKSSGEIVEVTLLQDEE